MIQHHANLVGQLGFGVSGPHGTPLVSPKDTVALVRHAHKLGLRYFDTAPSYGAGEAERRLGEALSNLPDHGCTISTKAGILSDGATRKRRDFSPGGICSSVDASLKRLHRSRVDVLYLHGPAPRELNDGLLDRLLALKEVGQIGALGVCGVGVELDAAISTGQFTHYMTPVHANLCPEALQRLARIREMGKLVGIETLALAKKNMSPLRASGVWRLARAFLRKSQSDRAASMTIGDAFEWSLKQGGADLVMTTTTRVDHLTQVVDLLIGLAESSIDPA